MCAAEPSALDSGRHSDARTTHPMTGPKSGHADADVEMPSFDGESLGVLRDKLQVPALHLFASVGSTLDVVHRLASEGAPHGTLVIADRQTRGRGRGGKTWESPPGSGLWITLLARPRDAVVPQVLTVRLGLAAAVALDGLAGQTVRIKWPNDLYLADRKLAGVLVEARWRGTRAEWLAVGLGINVTAPGHAERGGALGPDVHRLDVLHALMPSLRIAMDRADPELDAGELAQYDARDRARGSACVEPRHGTVRGISSTAELLIETDDGVVAVGSGSLVLAEEA